MKIKSNKLPQSENVFLGIDQSLSCTSLCLFDAQTLELKQIKPLYMGVPRITEIYDIFDEFLKENGSRLTGAAIEGYAYSAKGAVFNLGELGGVLRLALSKHGIPTIEVPPTFLKKTITGKGNSPKNVMIKELYKKYDVDVNDDNDGDAIALAIVAKHFFDEELHCVKAYRTDIQKNTSQIIGKHPKPMDVHKYFEGHEDMTVAVYEKTIRKKKETK